LRARQTLASETKLRTELQTLEELDPVDQDPEKLADLNQQCRVAQDEVAVLEREQKQFVAATQAELQNAKARAQLQMQKARADVFKQAMGTVRDVQQKLVDAAISGLLATARRFTDGIIPGELGYRDGDLGYSDGAIWVGHETFSGTEEALSYAGLSVALAADSDVRLVLFDEMGIVDPATKAVILKRMVELTEAGVIDQFIGADVSLDSDAAALTKAGVTIHLVKG